MRLKSLFAVASMVGISNGQLARFSPESGLSFSVNIPTSTSDTNSGSIYLQIRGPAAKQWIALGQGSQMSGANILIIYADGSGNVTVSPRLGQGHFEPQVNADAQVELLQGSGITNNQMIANIRCDTCLNWSGGDMSVSDASSNWIWSMKEGDPLDNPSPDASLTQHDIHGGFTFDLTKATGGSSNNPFVEAPATNPSGSRTTSATSPENTSDGSQQSEQDPPESGDDDNSGSAVATPFAHIPGWLKTHGILMGLAFVVFFPLGAISIRVLPASISANVHMSIQMIGFVISIAGLAYGIMLARDLEYLTETHPIIGMVVMGGLFFQPIVGLIHHWLFRSKGKRTILAYIHTYWGRALLILAIVNGGLGLQLANNTRSGEIAYGVVAGVMGAAWIAAVALYYIRGGSKRNVPPANKSEGNGRSP